MPREPLATRILRRFLASQPETRSVVAGFVPDKFWRSQKAELRKLLLAEIPERDRNPRDVDFKLLNELVPFFKRFKESFLGFEMHRFAEESLSNRVGYLVQNIEAIAKTYDEYHTATYGPYPINTVEEQVIQKVVFSMQDVFAKKVKTLRDALKGTWKTDERLIKLLAQRLVKKAPPNVLEAFNEELKWKDSVPPNNVIDTVWKYYASVGLDQAARKLITIDTKRSKLDPLAWIDMLQEVAANVFTKPEAFTEFDFHGVKVVVDDTTVDERDIQRYVRYLDHAYSLFKAKGVDKVWYGTFFIRCQGCGGVNYNNGGGVGGNYPIGPDVVNIFSRPGEFIVDLLAHELGHRYWFKFMNESQRGKFESVVKVHNTQRPSLKHDPSVPSLIPWSILTEAAEGARKARDTLEEKLLRFKNYKAKTYKEAIEEMSASLASAGRIFYNDVINATQFWSVDYTKFDLKVLHLREDMLKKLEQVRNHLSNLDPDLDNEIQKTPEPSKAPKSLDIYWWDIFEHKRDFWINAARHMMDEAVDLASVYVTEAVQEHNDKVRAQQKDVDKSWNEEYEADPRTVMPVTEYGTSNIDEAFAEVFSYYITGKEMDRDQIESFRSVLSSSHRPLENSLALQLGITHPPR